MGNKKSSSDYEIGYKKPPKHSQFQPGQSGNPRGRSKGSRNFKTDLLNTLKKPIPVSQNGKQRNISTQQAALMRLREKALGGDGRSLDRLLEFARIYNDEEVVERSQHRTQSDQEILNAYHQRLRLSSEQDNPNEGDGDE